MSDLFVTYCSSSRLSCLGLDNPVVVLCVADASIINPGLCPESDDPRPFPISHIVANLVSWTKSCSCGSYIYKYTIKYDDSQLSDTDRPLDSSDISGIFCEGCLASWMLELVGDEPYIRDNGDGTLTFVSPHGCEYTFTNGS